MSFWGELKRRNVFKVGAAYAIVAWLLIQIVSTVFPALNLPDWSVTLVTALLIVGFPIALLHAWAYEVTPDGIKRTKEVPLADSITHVTGRKLNYVLGGLLVIAVTLLIFDNLYLDRRVAGPEMATTVSDQTPAPVEEEEASKTIVVLPFKNLSSDPEQENFVDGLTVEISDFIGQIPDLKVTGRISSFTFKDSRKTAPEISAALGVEYILSGDVRKDGDNLRINVQLLKGIDGFELWSEKYNRELKDIFAVQEDIAAAVANELRIKLGIGKTFKQLGGTDNLEAYEHYLIAQGQINSGEFNKALESAEAAAALDPNFALAWATKADVHSALIVFGSADHAVSELGAALNAAERAVELEPNLAYAQCLLGSIKIYKGEWIEAESKYRKALKLPTGTLSRSEYLIAFHYLAVGHFKKANEIFEEELQNDPFDKWGRAYHILNSAFLGNTRQAEEEYKLGKELFGDQWIYGDLFISMARLGTGHVVSRDRIVYSDPIWDAAKEQLDSPENGLAELRRLYADDGLSSSNLIQIADWAAYFGDPEFTMDALEKGLDIQALGIFNIWYPTMHEVRQLPRFKEFVREIGLVDYWEQFGWPDLCRTLDNGDFVCD